MGNGRATEAPSEVGLARGSEGAGVEELQQYLSRFGYLRLEDAGEFNAVRGASPVPEAATRQFDEVTVEALRSYQRFYGLPTTGKLDEATATQMSKPRCGFPDVSDAAGVSSFTAQGNRWTNTDLRYGFQNFTPDLTQDEVRNAIAAAFALWSEVTPLTFTEVPVDQSPEIVIVFAAGDHGDGAANAFAGPGGVLAHAFYPPPNGGTIAGDAHFDEAETWSVVLPVPAGRFDFVSVAAHEFGHSLGLAHSSIAGALMWPTYSGQRHLAEDDVAGIQSIYGSRRGGWESLGGGITSGPDASSWAPGRLDIFARGTDNGLWRIWYENGWGSWESLGGGITSNPGAVSWGNGRIDIFARGTDNALWHKYYDGVWRP